MIKQPVIAFVHIEKTAGITMNFILRNSFGIKHFDVYGLDNTTKCFSQDEFEQVKKLVPRLKSVAGHRVRPLGSFGQNENIVFYTFLRDPIVRTASHYQYIDTHFPRQISPFEEWIDNPDHHNVQVRKIAGADNVEKAIEFIKNKFAFAGMVEDFSDSLQMLNASLPYDLKLVYIRKNVAQKTDMKNKLLNTPALRKKLIEANRSDIEFFEWFKEYYEYRKKAFRPETFKGLQEGSGSTSYYVNKAFRNLIYKPLVRVRNLKVNGNMKLQRQMVGLK